ncbi:zinc-binding dehydrogenase [Streptomyces phyllanthi]|uniref:2-deoxy-scyllo-inosamine dehydrogenase n=1 Tax=Streptomyces phyllanthi TaxID=1803180 RepID=A0A5N8WAZ4_9ACTN|nr:zinc-binding dehydrogenase [Streptomyces phyllanthi]MPY43598.1 zinc-binding dehydrogenase [Streptomyces phyllanthi]
MVTTSDPVPLPPRTHQRSRLVGSRRSALVTAPVPVCGHGQVLIRVRRVGVCASELPLWREGPGSGPVFMGHEPVGQVIAVGPDVTDCAVGDTVTGRIEHSFAQCAVADAVDVVVVPPDVPAHSALGEPFGCVVEGLRRTTVAVGDRVAVIGAGFIGLCLLQLLRHGGTARLLAVDPRTDARRHAVRNGADRALAPGQAHSLAARDSAAPGDAHGFDVVFEASGTQAGLDLATELVRQHGTLSILGYHQQTRSVDMRSWNLKAIDVVNAHVRDPLRLRESTRRGLDLMASGRVDPAALITHRYSLADIDQAFTDLAGKPEGFIKAVVEVG